MSKTTKTIEIINCDICNNEVEEYGKAEWVYTCSRCESHFCISCGDNYRGENSSTYFSLCNKCLKECDIKDEDNNNE